MKKSNYLKSSINTPSEEDLLKIPCRKEYLIREVGNGKDVLDAGCFTGCFSTLLVEKGNRVVGIEANAESAEIARQRGIEVIEADLEEKLPLEDESFDVVVAFEIIEHLFDTLGFLEECHRVLRPGGRVIISTPNLNSIPNRLRIIFGLHIPSLGTFPGDSHGDHIRIFNVNSLKGLLTKAGFNPVSPFGVSYLPLPLRIPFKYFPSLADIIMMTGLKKEG